jgi:putative ABC transport system permease protein
MNEPSTSPPRLFIRFFRWFCHPELKDTVEGDLMELYGQRVKLLGKRKADRRFILDVLLLFRPGIIKPVSGYKRLNHYAMFKSYFKIGWRNLLKNKGYALINIGGLAIGMAVAMVIGLWVYDELSFNKYHHNYDRIVQIMKGGTFEGKHYVGQDYLPYPLIDELATTYKSNFKHVIPIQSGYEYILSVNDKRITKTGMFAGESAPEMFTLKMIHGTRAGLSELRSIMLSESTARALFGDIDPVDKDLIINNTKSAKVTGVYEDLPRNTRFYGTQFIMPWELHLVESPWIKEQNWENHFLFIYAEIQPNTTISGVSANIINAEANAIRNLAYMKDELKYNWEILVLPMKDWHLHANFKEGVLEDGPVQFVWFIGAIGVFVLLLACINFMNLSTARSEKRAKEVGIRKTIGSVRLQLVYQFFSESFLVVILAFVFSILFVALSLPWFNSLSGKEMMMPWQNLWFWLTCFVFLLVTGILAGSYPALYLSSFSPVKVLKGAFRADRFATTPRKVLVVVQFTVSIILIVCTIVIYNQIVFARNRPVGYTREGLLMIQKKSDDFSKNIETLRSELKNCGAVSEISESAGTVTSIWSGNGGFNWKGKDPSFEANFNTLSVSPEFGNTVGWQFIEGRDFSREMASDSSGFVLNEAAVKYMKLKNPVGETIHWTNRAWSVDKDFTVLGVIRDMLMGSPFEPVRPAIFLIQGWHQWLNIKINPQVSTGDALPKIEAVFRKVIPLVPFDYKFVDQEYAMKFAAEEKIGKLASVFATLAILISCLGLFGLASFVAEQRTKEIGIRKVLGATVGNLWKMLSREFVVLVVISSVIATPVSYYLLFNWLKKYDYHTEISWWIFAITGIGALCITLLTVSYQSVKAALMNPVRSLRSE